MNVKTIVAWGAGIIIAYLLYKHFVSSKQTTPTVVTVAPGGTASSNTAATEASAFQNALSGYAAQDNQALAAMGNAITNGFASTVSGQTSMMTGITKMFEAEAAGFKKLFDGLTGQVSALATEVQTDYGNVSADLGKLSTSLDSLTSTLTNDYKSLSTSLSTIISAQKTQGTAATTASNYSVGTSAYLAVKAALGGENTTMQAIGGALPQCMTSSGPDFACIGQAILSGKITIADIVAQKGSF